MEDSLRNDSVSEDTKAEKRLQHALKETEFLRLKRSRLGVDDFDPLKVIGRGAFGEVSYIPDVINYVITLSKIQLNLRVQLFNSSFIRQNDNLANGYLKFISDITRFYHFWKYFSNKRQNRTT